VESIDRKTWAGRYSLLTPWFFDIINAVKRDCKNEHLRLNPGFVREHFSGMPLHRITLDEMRAVYLRLILGGNDQLAEFISNRWLFRNMELYNFFEKALSEVLPDFEKISELTQEQAEKLIREASEKFSCEDVFCFVVLNDVVIPQDVFNRLQRQAVEALAKRQKEAENQGGSPEEKWRQEVERLKERQEKKIQEMTKRHQQEVVRLNSEIAKLKEIVTQLKKKPVLAGV
jgi:hypothetical protein